MPLRKPAGSATDGADEAAESTGSELAGDELTLAEAEAAAAEAAAEAARARARALRLRQEQSAESASAEADADEVDPDGADEGTEDLEDAPIEHLLTNQPQRPERTGGWGRALRWGAGVVVVLVSGALIAASVYMVVHNRDVAKQQRMFAEYQAAASTGVVTLMSLDFQRAEEDVQAVVDNTTGDFRADFESHKDDFVKMAKESKVVTEAVATAAAVESMTDHEAVVLVSTATKVTNAAGAVQEPRNWRLAVTMTREGDQIKMSKVEFVP